MGGDLLRPQTGAQILRCFNLGGYTARVVDGGVQVRGPQPLAGPLPASIRARREELVGFLNEWCGGEWPPAPGSEIARIQETLGCGLPAVLQVFDTPDKESAA